MADKLPTIAYWCGTPLSELPREELEQALIDAHRQLEAAQQREHERSISHIRDMANAARAL